MSKFEVETIDGLPPFMLAPLYKLRVDGRCYLDEFCDQMQHAGNHVQALDKLQSILIELCRGRRVSPNWLKELKHRDKKDPYPDYEVRAKRLRLYLFEDEGKGRIIVLGELKKGSKTQTKAIQKMRKIKLEYFASRHSPPSAE